jgi:hypothetical protein
MLISLIVAAIARHKRYDLRVSGHAQV